MHVRVSGMVWLPKAETNPTVLDYFRKKLLLVPRKLGNYGGDEDVTPTPIKCWSETPEEFGIPRAFWFATAKGDYDYEWDLAFGEEINITSKLKQTGPYAEQGKILDKLMSYYEPAISGDDDLFDGTQAGRALGGIFQADPGFGKTNVTLELIKRLGVTTLVLVHKEFLFKQWIRRIERWLPDAKVGRVRGKTCDFEGKDIVIAMIESVALEDGDRYPPELYDWPGLLVLDEVHRVGAPTWNPTPEKFSAALRLG